MYQEHCGACVFLCRCPPTCSLAAPSSDPGNPALAGLTPVARSVLGGSSVKGKVYREDEHGVLDVLARPLPHFCRIYCRKLRGPDALITWLPPSACGRAAMPVSRGALRRPNPAYHKSIKVRFCYPVLEKERQIIRSTVKVLLD
jgi:hypothetical protein